MWISLLYSVPFTVQYCTVILYILVERRSLKRNSACIMPDVDIESYLSTSDASTLQTGTLRKKSRDLKLWKIRKYSIRSDSTCITYNEKKNIPTDIINITCVRVKQGSNENLDKSGSTDFSETPGVCLVVDAVNYGNLEIVLDSAREAEEFVFAICSTAKAIDVSVSFYYT